MTVPTVPTVSDAVWSEQGTTPDAIATALRELLAERHAENGGFVPARVLNMIVFVDREWSGEIANRLRGVGRYHASRLVVLSYEAGRTRLDARASIAATGAPGPGEVALLRETVFVEIGERHLDDLLTIVDPLVVTDLPTLLWSPHGHAEIADALLPLSQAVLVDSVDEPVWQEAIERARALSEQTYVVDLAWLRSTPWRERIAATFDPAPLRPQLRAISGVTVRHHPASTIAGVLLLGWLASRLRWQAAPLAEHDESLAGEALDADGAAVALRLEAAREQEVRGLAGITLETRSGRRLRLDRGPGGLHAHYSNAGGAEREWTIPGASRGETGILGEGIRQALLRDPTYVPALKAAAEMSRGE
ncbi:MAG TPA: glucose-6-phosphate dehydrogenase assembly protein OpcA [Solirubrobacteraceae bacterium]|jgi:glucose-6-phosphate dehydrogenase assembly protein OpcA